MTAELVTAWAGMIGALAAALALLGKTRAEVARMMAEVAQIRAELQPDHGSSARDSLDRTEAAVSGIKTQLDQLHQTVGHLANVDADDRARALVDHNLIYRRIHALEERKTCSNLSAGRTITDGPQRRVPTWRRPFLWWKNWPPYAD